MKIDTEKVRAVLDDRAVSAYSLEQATGVARDRIAKYRNDKIKFENFSLKTIMSIQQWIDDSNY